MKKIICVGSACKDIFFPTAEGVTIETPEDILSKSKIGFELGAKYKIDERYEVLGGCAVNVAAGLSCLGVATECYAHVGNDAVAEWILKELKKNKIGTMFVTKDEKLPSDMSAIIVDKKSAERVIFSNQKANGRLVIDPDAIGQAEWIFMGDLHGDWQGQLDLISDVAKQKGIGLIFNPRQANIHECAEKIAEKIAGVRLLFLNKDETMEIISKVEKQASNHLENEVELLKRLHRLGAEISVITDGVRGAWVFDGKKVIFAKGVKVEALDTTGAGDAFCSGFSGGFLKGKSLEECLAWGIANSSNEVRFYGAIDGLLDEKTITQRARAVEIEILHNIIG